eukprot:360530-Chlamydomonas_euryale.AAC.7
MLLHSGSWGVELVCAATLCERPGPKRGSITPMNNSPAFYSRACELVTRRLHTSPADRRQSKPTPPCQQKHILASCNVSQACLCSKPEFRIDPHFAVIEPNTPLGPELWRPRMQRRRRCHRLAAQRVNKRGRGGGGGGGRDEMCEASALSKNFSCAPYAAP